VRAIVLDADGLRMAQYPEPQITAEDDIKVRTIAVGVCGTDRALLHDHRAAPELVIGHEMLGQVIEVGPAVRRVKPNDLVVFTVRRSCGQCVSCAQQRSDMCSTGDFGERGIRGLHGFQCEYVVDRESNAVVVPEAIGEAAVLVEPLSIVEKAIHEVLLLQRARLPDALAHPHWLHDKRTLVAGLGPVGLLAALVLRLRGAHVFGLDVVDPGDARVRWLQHIGGEYIDGRRHDERRIDETIGPADLIVEAAGAPALAFNLIEALGLNGAYALTGIPIHDRTIRIAGSELMRALVLKNQLLVGSVNSARDHFLMAVDDLLHARLLWGSHIDGLITERRQPEELENALQERAGDEIKVVIDWRGVRDVADGFGFSDRAARSMGRATHLRLSR
jgi:threonine dehydrogenase-like Zn-dependent dehydrogenase